MHLYSFKVGVGGILSPASFDFSHDEGFDSEEDSDHYEDFDDSDSGKIEFGFYFFHLCCTTSICPSFSNSLNDFDRFNFRLWRK